MLDAVGAEGGATLAELAGLTGWLPHTTRAALTRLRQRGYALERLDLNGRRTYRLGAAR
jgi:DNA-binding IclR family transcriptional regulator